MVVENTINTQENHLMPQGPTIHRILVRTKINSQY
jgi:hypothetical protein